MTVFGATGAIGRRVVERALTAGYEVHALVRDPAKALEPRVSTTVSGLTDGQAVARAVEGSVRHVVESKRREYVVFRDSGLDWTLVRPPRVVEGEPTGRVASGATLARRQVTGGDLADFLVGQVSDRSYVRAAPYVSS